MMVLDTQVDSQLQRSSEADGARLERKITSLGDRDLRITIITPYEQLSDCLGQIKLHRDRPEDDLTNIRLFDKLIAYFAGWLGRILLFDEDAAAHFRGFESRLVQKIGARDSRIAAIVLCHGCLLLTANLRDFEQVPGLRVEGW